MVAVSFPKEQILMCCNKTKDVTFRKPTTKITKNTIHFLCNYKYGVFAEAPLKSTFIISVDDIDNYWANRAGYNTREEYLAKNWNSDFDTRVGIEWDKTQLKVYWDVVKQNGVL